MVVNAMSTESWILSQADRILTNLVSEVGDNLRWGVQILSPPTPTKFAAKILIDRKIILQGTSAWKITHQICKILSPQIVCIGKKPNGCTKLGKLAEVKNLNLW